MSENMVEGLWDCVYCNQTAIKARFDTCPFCGKARGIDTIFYLPTDLASATLTKEEEAKVSKLPDWLCDYCGAYNNSSLSVCPKCGSDRKESKKDYGMIHKLTGKLFGKR